MQEENKYGQYLCWGEGALKHIQHYTRQEDLKGFTLVRGQASFKNVGDKVRDSWKNLIKNEIVIEHGLPDLGKLADLYTTILDKMPACILAVGGGLVIDSAKALIDFAISDGLAAPRLLVVPTTAGSGSEATPFAVVYEGKTKTSLSRPALLPEAVFIDPVVYLGMPVRQRAISGIDAWCQSIESCWSNKATTASVELAEMAFNRIYSELPAFDRPVSLKLALGAYYAGCAIRTTQTTGAHALSYHLTAEHGIPHGQAVCIFLPVMMRYNLRSEQHNAGVERVIKWMGTEGEEDTIHTMLQFIRECGLKASLKELGLGDLSMERLADSINYQRFSNNPRPYERAALLECIEWSLNLD